MVINISVQYNGGLLPDIILLSQGYYQWGTRLTLTELRPANRNLSYTSVFCT